MHQQWQQLYDIKEHKHLQDAIIDEVSKTLSNLSKIVYQ